MRLNLEQHKLLKKYTVGIIAISWVIVIFFEVILDYDFKKIVLFLPRFCLLVDLFLTITIKIKKIDFSINKYWSIQHEYNFYFCLVIKLLVVLITASGGGFALGSAYSLSFAYTALVLVMIADFLFLHQRAGSEKK